MIYEAREDSFLIGKYAKIYSKGKVLDLGSGSGYLAEIALENTKDVLAVDIDKESVEFIKKKGIKVVKSDLFSNIKGKFDLIIFNPPYLPRDEFKEDKALIGGEKGNEVIKEFLKDAKDYLKKDGKILLLFSSLSGDVLNLFEKYNYKFRLLEQKDLFFEKLYCYLLN